MTEADGWITIRVESKFAMHNTPRDGFFAKAYPKHVNKLQHTSEILLYLLLQTFRKGLSRDPKGLTAAVGMRWRSTPYFKKWLVAAVDRINEATGEKYKISYSRTGAVTIKRQWRPKKARPEDAVDIGFAGNNLKAKRGEASVEPAPVEDSEVEPEFDDDPVQGPGIPPDILAAAAHSDGAHSDSAYFAAVNEHASERRRKEVARLKAIQARASEADLKAAEAELAKIGSAAACEGMAAETRARGSGEAPCDEGAGW